MKQMSSFDIKVCVAELQRLVGGRVEKLYHYPPDEIRLKIYAREKFDLIIEAGKRIHLTKFPKEAPKFPSPFAMLLRKHLEGSRVVAIEQKNFDRVVILEFEREKRKRIVTELFSKGNVILMEDDRIIMPLKELRTQPGERKVETSKEVVRYLASSGLGGLYAEEICLRAGVNKKKKFSELSKEEKKRIENEIEKIKNFELKPQIIIKDSKFVDVVPMDLIYYKEYEKKFFSTFNEALDEFYSKIAIESEKESEEVEKLKKRLKIQEETIQKYELEAIQSKEIAETIYANYPLIEEIIHSLKSGIMAKEVKSFDPRERKAILVLDGKEIEVHIDKGVHGSAELYYERAKKAREKIERIKVAIQKTLEELKKEREKMRVGFTVRRKREWFEDYRWFITSDGFLAIGGRNAKMNGEIVSKHLENRDLFFHTQTPGAPAVVLKLGQDAPKSSILETAEFSAIYSSLWKEGKHSGEVYYVKPEQVLRAAKPGEFLPKGSFYIVGERSYVEVELRCAIGVELEKMRVIGGPVNAVKKWADYYVELEIGEESAEKLSVEIAKILAERAGDSAYIVKVIARPDEIAKFLPPGKSRIT